MAEQSYPVLIECTEYRIIWLEAESAEDAAAIVENDSELISRSESYDGGWTAKAPTPWDWENIYGYGGAAQRMDAHVVAHEAELHRRESAAARAACTADGHPDLQAPMSDGRSWCPGCREWLYAPAVVS